jgi:integrase
MSRRLVSENPLIDIKLDKPVFEPKPAPSLNEVNALLDIASDSDRGPISILAFTGMRSGELRRLRPADIDIAGNWIHIHSRPDGKTKTKLSRKVPIHPRLLPVLRVAVQENRPYLFTAPRSSKYPAGDHWMNVRLLNDRFASLVTRMGLPAGRESGFVLHSLRHFFETFGVNAGIPQRVIDTWLGHRSDRSMAAVYYRLGDGESQLFMQKVPFGTGQPAAEAGKELVR